MKAVDKDAVMAALKDRLIRAQNRGDKNDISLTNAVMTIMRLMPEIDVEDGINCGKCFFYDAQMHRCSHRYGLGGRIKSAMYCSYGSYDWQSADEDTDDSAFDEFEEDDADG